jgi:hypothetical protein
VRLLATFEWEARDAKRPLGSRRAQFQLWIFSYTILVGSAKKCVSRVMIDFTDGFALNLPKGALAD